MNGSYFLLTNLLSEDEKRVITGIAAHIERGEKRVGIQQIASENFLSAASIVKMCKRLGFDGYSELYYYLSRQMDRRGERSAENLKTLVDNYSDELVNGFCALLDASRQAKMFTTGEGFSSIVGEYIAQRLSICGFMVYNNVHFYDHMLFCSAHDLTDEEAAPSVMFAVSQSGETEPVLNDVRHARQNGHKIVTFTKRADSALARLSDLSSAVQSDSYASAFARLASGQVDVLVTYADARRDYAERWNSEFGREGSIWEETGVIGVTAPIYNDTISVSKNSPIMDADLIAALQQAFINIGNTDAGKQVIAIYSHNGYQIAQSSDYDNERAAQKLIQELSAAN